LPLFLAILCDLRKKTVSGAKLWFEKAKEEENQYTKLFGYDFWYLAVSVHYIKRFIIKIGSH
jgi:hypothetical protein